MAVDSALTCRRILLFPNNENVLASGRGMARFAGIARGSGQEMFCQYFEEEADRQDTSSRLIAVDDPAWHRIGRTGQLDP